MQIAGRTCWVCNTHVGIMRDGAGCEKCQIVFHRSCVPDGNCPKCGQLLLPTDQVHSRPSAPLQTELDRPKSVTVLGRLTLIGALIWTLRAMGAMASIGTAGANAVGATGDALLNAGFNAALGSGFLNRHDWARRWYLLCAPILLGAGVVLDNQVTQLGAPTVAFAIQVLVYIVWAFILTRQRAVAFFQKRRLVSQASR
jgi:hypothetical protein